MCMICVTVAVKLILILIMTCSCLVCHSQAKAPLLGCVLLLLHTYVGVVVFELYTKQQLG